MKLEMTIFVWSMFRLRIWMQWLYHEPALPSLFPHFFFFYSLHRWFSLPVVTDQEWFIWAALFPHCIIRTLSDFLRAMLARVRTRAVVYISRVNYAVLLDDIHLYMSWYWYLTSSVVQALSWYAQGGTFMLFYFISRFTFVTCVCVCIPSVVLS